MHADRLLKLADFLETVPEENFDISGWETAEATKPEGDRPGQCGFAGCAVGWAAHVELFDGFVMRDGDPLYQGKTDWDAVDELFGFKQAPGELSKEGLILFSGSEYRGYEATPAQVAARIRQFVASKATSSSDREAGSGSPK